jgi:hypothetical protein
MTDVAPAPRSYSAAFLQEAHDVQPVSPCRRPDRPAPARLDRRHFHDHRFRRSCIAFQSIQARRQRVGHEAADRYAACRRDLSHPP